MCKAKSCRYWSKCVVKRDCCDDRCNDYERSYDYTPTYETPYERTRAKVYSTGNKWAIENFKATHN